MKLEWHGAFERCGVTHPFSVMAETEDEARALVGRYYSTEMAVARVLYLKIFTDAQPIDPAPEAE
jgi:hypothetical protein